MCAVKFNIEVEGETIDDIDIALSEVVRRIGEGHFSGSDNSCTGRYSFKSVNSNYKFTVLDLVKYSPVLANYDYKLTDSENYKSLTNVLRELGYKLSEEDSAIEGEYNDIEAYYNCEVELI
ncbi:MAG: hypothetical protein K0R54_636 [Clostridiaceae bacterium]|jgi:hypothetical protein|nr:hypothetical protein [Clostridiaceae bacterium]